MAKSDIQTFCTNPGSSHTVDIPCALTGFHVTNLSAGTLYLMMFDDDDVPANGAVPLRVWEIGPGQTYEWDLPERLPFLTGMVFALSTTQATLTITPTDDGCLAGTYYES